MHVGIYGRLEQAGLAPLFEGFKSIGHRASLRRLSAFSKDQVEDFDLVVCYGKRGLGHIVIDSYRDRAPTFVFDFASLVHDQHPTAWCLHPGDLNRIAPPELSDASRMWLLPERVPARAAGQKVLLCGPTRRDAGHPFDEAGLENWLLLAASILLQQGLDVYWRPHPKDVWDLRAGLPLAHPGIKIEEALSGEPLAAIATYASTVGWTALMGGLPVYCSDDAAYAPAAETVFSRPPRRVEPEKLEALLRQVTWTMFLEEEMRSGLAPSFLVRQAEQWSKAA